jgi:uncharacterized protein
VGAIRGRHQLAALDGDLVQAERLRRQLSKPVAFRHLGVRDGFEVAWFAPPTLLRGGSTFIEEGAGHHIAYEITLAPDGSTSRASIRSLSRAIALTRAGDTWLIDGVTRPDLAECTDVDLESSAVTNALPVARLGLEVGETARALAAWVRADLTVERLEQTYTRLDERRYDYVSDFDGFRTVLVYGADGLIVDYPGIAMRA